MTMASLPGPMSEPLSNVGYGNKAGAVGTKSEGCVSGMDTGRGGGRAQGLLKAGNGQVSLVLSINKLTSIY